MVDGDKETGRDHVPGYSMKKSVWRESAEEEALLPVASGLAEHKRRSPRSLQSAKAGVQTVQTRRRGELGSITLFPIVLFSTIAFVDYSTSRKGIESRDHVASQTPSSRISQFAKYRCAG